MSKQTTDETWSSNVYEWNGKTKVHCMISTSVVARTFQYEEENEDQLREKIRKQKENEDTWRFQVWQHPWYQQIVQNKVTPNREFPCKELVNRVSWRNRVANSFIIPPRWPLILYTGTLYRATFRCTGPVLSSISMFCALSQNYQHLFEKYLHLIVNCPKNSKMVQKFNHARQFFNNIIDRLFCLLKF